MKKLLTMRLMLALCLLLVCGRVVRAAFAEMGVDSESLSWINQMAYLNGQAYGMTSVGGWRARTTIYAQTEKGMEPVWTGEGRGRGLFAVGDKLVLIAEKPTDFWEELFYFKYPPLGEKFVEEIDPVTWDTELLPIPADSMPLCMLDGALLRWRCWQEEGLPRVEIYRWDGADWAESFVWTGETPLGGSSYTELFPGFLLLDQQLHFGGVRDLRILTLADRREHLLTNVEPRSGNALDAVLDGDMLYLLGDSGLWRFDMTTGARELLLPGMVAGFIINERYIVGYTASKDVDQGACIQVFDRETAALLREVIVPQRADYWLLTGDTLYLQDYTKGGYMVNGRMQSQRPYAAVIDLTTGECRITPFEY